MTDINDIKQKLGENTEKLEKKVQDFWNQSSPYYSNLEPWKRGLILLGLAGLTALTIYWLVREDKSKVSKKRDQLESLTEERLLKKLELFKKLRG